jgi:propionyl-CoA carboxylase beta chain
MSVDEIIQPHQSRFFVAAALQALAGANRPRYRHDNLPQ